LAFAGAFLSGLVGLLPNLSLICAKIFPMHPRIVFMGSPDFAVPTLHTLAKERTVVGIVTQPDRPAGRGQALNPPPVKTLAQELGLPFIQPMKLNQPEAMEQLRNWAPDLIIVAAFGQILRKEVLDLPEHGCVNVHASLLPRWRGAAPISAAILHGDAQTGVTIMLMDTGVDTGPILSQRPVAIQPDDTMILLSQRLAEVGAHLLIETLPAYLSGEIQPHPQDNTLATYAAMLKKEDGALDFNQTATALERRVRAFQPWPGTYMEWSGSLLKILSTSTAETNIYLVPGKRLVHNGFPAIQTAQGILVLKEVQPASKKPMSGKSFLHGAKNWA
jgi:methionyl-tRNA formyltransferase